MSRSQHMRGREPHFLSAVCLLETAKAQWPWGQFTCYHADFCLFPYQMLLRNISHSLLPSCPTSSLSTGFSPNFVILHFLDNGQNSGIAYILLAVYMKKGNQTITVYSVIRNDLVIIDPEGTRWSSKRTEYKVYDKSVLPSHRSGCVSLRLQQDDINKRSYWYL